MSEHHDPAEVDKHVRFYLKIFGTLLALTILTVAISEVHLPKHFGIFVGLLIATVKGGLVAMFFMHLLQELRGNKIWISLTLALSALFFGVLILLPLFSSLNAIGYHW